jgi:tRNA threonylcarbamoyladenosine biosynthesis protein TsaE
LIATVHKESELKQVAEMLIGAYPQRRVFAFYGAMGAGKTTFIRMIADVLGAVDVVQSPSFAIINEYKTREGDSLFHFDFYRMKKPEEAYDIGYEDYLYSGSYCFLEWPEVIEDLLPEDAVKVKISGDPVRWIEY